MRTQDQDLDTLRTAVHRMRHTADPTWQSVADLLDLIATKEAELLAGPFGNAISLAPEPLFELHPLGLTAAIEVARRYLAATHDTAETRS